MRKALALARSIIGRIWGILLLLRWPLLFQVSGKFLPSREGRGLRWCEPLIFVPVLRPPWKSGKRLVLRHLRFEVTDFILIGLSLWMILAVMLTPSVQRDVVGMVASIEMIRNIASLMILISLFDRDGGKVQTGTLVVLGLVYNWSLFHDGVLGSLPFATGAFMILLLQFLFLPASRWWQSRGTPDPFDDPEPLEEAEQELELEQE